MIKPKEIVPLSKLNQSVWYKVQTPYGGEDYLPKIVDINAINHQKYDKRCRNLIRLLLILLIISIIVISIVLPIIFLPEQSSNNTNFSIISPSPIKIRCLYPFVLNEYGQCINVMIDSNNCGYLTNRCSNNWSCSAGICQFVPGIKLNNPEIIWSSAINGSADDQMFNVTLPWNITLYQRTTDRVIVTTDGVLCFDRCATTYTESQLPTNAFGGVTVFPFWDDLYIYINTSQGIYYQSEGNSPNRQLIFEYYMSHYLQPSEFYHFQILFKENSPGIVQYKYFDATDGGDTCTIGLQASITGPYLLYSYDQPNSVQPNLTLTFDTNRGIFNRSIRTSV